jgi:hypothetical protein
LRRAGADSLATPPQGRPRLPGLGEGAGPLAAPTDASLNQARLNGAGILGLGLAAESGRGRAIGTIGRRGDRFKALFSQAVAPP